MALNYDDYKNTKPYPSEEKVYRIYKHGKVEVETSDYAAFLKEREKRENENSRKKTHVAWDFENVNVEKIKEMRQTYREEENRLYFLFKHDLEVEYGTEKHPKKDKLFSMAWEDGHSEGYYSVENYYSKYAELLND